MFDFDLDKFKLIAFRNDEASLKEEVLAIKELIKSKPNGQKLFDEIAPKIDRIEFGTGGEVVYRGYYCPDLFSTFSVGGCNRGKLLKRVTKKSKITYEFGYCEDSLSLVKKFDPSDQSIWLIELIERISDIELGLEFEVGKKARKIGRLTAVHISQFDGDKLLNTRTYLKDYYNDYEYEYNCDWYMYENDLLTGVKHVDYIHNRDLKMLHKQEITFIHDADGCPVQFIVDNHKDIINDITKVNHEYYRREHLQNNYK